MTNTPILYAYAPISTGEFFKCQGIFTGTNMDAITYRQDFTADQVVVVDGYQGDRIPSARIGALAVPA